MKNYYLFNRRNPLALCKKVLHLSNFDYINEFHIKNNKYVAQSCTSRYFVDNKINLSLFPLEHFKRHIFEA